METNGIKNGAIKVKMIYNFQKKNKYFFFFCEK
jgi:hypothetical protein